MSCHTLSAEGTRLRRGQRRKLFSINECHGTRNCVLDSSFHSLDPSWRYTRVKSIRSVPLMFTSACVPATITTSPADRTVAAVVRSEVIGKERDDAINS